MSAPTINGSAYPAPVAVLLPKARKLANELGEVPSRNRLMTEFRIGAPKANALRAALDPDPTDIVTDTDPDPDPAVAFEQPRAIETAQVSPQAVDAVDPVPATAFASTPARRATMRPWPVVLLAAPAFVAVWSGWVGLGELTGFGTVRPLPGIVDGFTINSAITLPIGVETYAAFALRVWLSGQVPATARRFAKWSEIGSLILGALGQVAYHLLIASGVTSAPWQITTLVSCLPVAVLGMGAALAHLLRSDDIEEPRHG